MLYMEFSKIIGQNHIKKHLQYSAEQGRIPHAQLFIAPEGVGALEMAIAYAQFVINLHVDSDEKRKANSLKFTKVQHPDLHFSFPFYGNKETILSDTYRDQWNEFITQYPYGSMKDWMKLVDVKNQQLIIPRREADNIAKKLSLKAYEGGYKVMIIWMADKMNPEANNTLLKLLEEPPHKTLFLLIAENEKEILPTIYSRCQVIHFNPLSDKDIATALMEKHQLSEDEAMTIAKTAQGNYNKAIKIAENEEDDDLPFDKWFVQWMRAAYLAKKDPSQLVNLTKWGDELSLIGRENQKLFLKHCIEVIRQAFLYNYNVKNLVYYKSKEEGFLLSNFAKFVNDKNINDFYRELNDSIYHIERNGNPKIIFSNLSIKLTRFLHKGL